MNSPSASRTAPEQQPSSRSCRRRRFDGRRAGRRSRRRSRVRPSHGNSASSTRRGRASCSSRAVIAFSRAFRLAEADALGDSLQRIGVEVRTRAIVTRITPTGVARRLSRSRAYRAVAPSGGGRRSPGHSEVALDRSGRVPVEPDLSIPGHRRVRHRRYERLPNQRGHGFAPRSGAGRARCSRAPGARKRVRPWDGRPTREFHYPRRGTMATIGARRPSRRRRRPAVRIAGVARMVVVTSCS